jgi:methionyl-tRNA synthetase
MGKRFYLTTAIDYTNGAPHLGHAYEKIVTDVIARAHRSMGAEVFFLTGLDEHGQKVQQAAQLEGKDPQAYCDELALQWREFVRRLEISNDDFIRTTQPRHREVVQAMLQKLFEQGDIYKAPFTGWYSVKEETFLTDKDRNADGTWDASWGQVVQLQEDNWYFRMSRHQAWLIEHIEQHPEFVHPEIRRNEVLGFLRSEALEDLKISRPKSRLSWGIPLPFDPEYVNYVWFDALTNYFSVPASAGDPQATDCLGTHYRRSALEPATPPAARNIWPADLHVIGKDIVKFHAVYWPIMLRAAGAPLPRQILAHGWWQKDGRKMSKSDGNIVDPIAVIDEWGVDAFRYYVVRELDLGADGNWTDAGFKVRYNSELANGLGNLLNRAVNMLTKYRAGLVPKRSDELAAETAAAVATVRTHLEGHELQAALVAIWALINRGNLYVEQTRPFSLAKDPSQATRLDEVLYNLVELCRVLAVLLWPFLPGTAGKMFAQLKVCDEPSDWNNSAWGALTEGHQVGEPLPLFPRRDLPPKAK